MAESGGDSLAPEDSRDLPPPEDSRDLPPQDTTGEGKSVSLVILLAIQNISGKHKLSTAMKFLLTTTHYLR